MADTPYFRWYDDGTVAFTKGTTTVTGTDTFWTSAGIKAGDIFIDHNRNFYEITDVASSTSITLGTPYAGDTGSNKSYSIIRTFNATMTANIASQLATLLKEIEQRYDLDMKTITGKSAFDLAKDSGFTGTVSEWLNSLTAYGVAVKNGYTGTAAQWLDSLSAYGIAVKNGYTGTQAEWLESLKAAGEWSTAQASINTLNTRTAIFTNSGVPAGGWDSQGIQRGGFHNSIARGKNLGKTITDAQWTAIRNMTFDDMYIGDYWVINGHQYVIAKFCMRKQQIDTNPTAYGDVVVLTPSQFERDIASIKEKWRFNTTNTFVGGFASSYIYKEGAYQYLKERILTDIPEEHILSRTATGDNQGAECFYISSAVDEAGDVTGVIAVPGLQIAPLTLENIVGNGGYSGKPLATGNIWSNRHFSRVMQLPYFMYAGRNAYSLNGNYGNSSWLDSYIAGPTGIWGHLQTGYTYGTYATSTWALYLQICLV